MSARNVNQKWGRYSSKHLARKSSNSREASEAISKKKKEKIKMVHVFVTKNAQLQNKLIMAQITHHQCTTHHSSKNKNSKLKHAWARIIVGVHSTSFTFR